MTEPENTVSAQMNEAGCINLPASFEEVSARVKELQSSCAEQKVKCAKLKGNNSCHVREQRVMEEQLKETTFNGYNIHFVYSRRLPDFLLHLLSSSFH